MIAPDNGICTPELVPFNTYLVYANYIVYVLRSPHIDYVVNSVTYGVKMPRVGTETMVNLLIPLPPLSEQKRIVAKIEELLPLIGRYAVAYEKLEQFNAKFPEDMKKSILQYAIQGKLVEQRAEEGTGEELYQQIQTEKQHLIAEKKIKKEIKRIYNDKSKIISEKKRNVIKILEEKLNAWNSKYVGKNNIKIEYNSKNAEYIFTQKINDEIV